MTALRDHYSDRRDKHRRKRAHRRRVQFKRAVYRADALTTYRRQILSVLTDAHPTSVMPIAEGASDRPLVALTVQCVGETATYTVTYQQLPDRLQTRAGASAVSRQTVPSGTPETPEDVNTERVFSYFTPLVGSPNRYLSTPFAGAGPSPVAVGWPSASEYVSVGSVVRDSAHPDAVVESDVIHPGWTGEYLFARDATIPLLDGGGLRVIDRWTEYQSQGGDGTAVCHYKLFTPDRNTVTHTQAELLDAYRIEIGPEADVAWGADVLEACGIDSAELAPLGATAPGTIAPELASREVRIVTRWLDDGDLLYGLAPVRQETPCSNTEREDAIHHHLWPTEE